MGLIGNIGDGFLLQFQKYVGMSLEISHVYTNVEG
jgi:hypothetical protein